MAVGVLLDVRLVDHADLDLLHFVLEGAVTVRLELEQGLLDRHRETLDVLVVLRAELEQLRDLVWPEEDTMR